MPETKIIGAAELRRKFKTLDQKMQTKTLVAASKKGANVVLTRARELAPRDTGTLATRGLQVRTTKRRKHYGENSVTNTKAGSHAVLQEYGVAPHQANNRRHPGHKPQPFMRPALDEKREEVIATITHDLKVAIVSAAR